MPAHCVVTLDTTPPRVTLGKAAQLPSLFEVAVGVDEPTAWLHALLREHATGREIPLTYDGARAWAPATVDGDVTVEIDLADTVLNRTVFTQDFTIADGRLFARFGTVALIAAVGSARMDARLGASSDATARPAGYLTSRTRGGPRPEQP